MNKNFYLFGIVAVVVFVGFGFLYFSKNKTIEQPSQQQQNTYMQDKDSVEKQDKNVQVKNNNEVLKEANNIEKNNTGAKYVNYSSQELAQNKDKKRVLFFFANWCPTCKKANEEFTKNLDQLPEDLVLIKTNYNDTETDEQEKELAKKYGITYQHTFLYIDSQDQVITKWNGGDVEMLLTKLSEK